MVLGHNTSGCIHQELLVLKIIAQNRCLHSPSNIVIVVVSSKSSASSDVTLQLRFFWSDVRRLACAIMTSSTSRVVLACEPPGMHDRPIPWCCVYAICTYMCLLNDPNGTSGIVELFIVVHTNDDLSTLILEDTCQNGSAYFMAYFQEY